MRLSIGKRLFFGFFVLVALETGLAIFGVRNIERLAAHYRRGMSVMEEIGLFHDIVLCVADLKARIDGDLLRGHEDGKEKFQQSLAECKKKISQKRGAYAIEAMPDVVNKTERAISHIEALGAKIFSDDVSLPRDGRQIFLEEAGQIVAQVESSLDAYNIKYIAAEMERLVAEESFAVRRTRLVALIFSLLIVVFTLLLGFVLVWRLLLPFRVLRKSLQRVARGGDMQNVVLKTGDEFEALASDFNLMLDKLKTSVVSKDYFNQIIQNMSDILFVVDRHGAVEFVNKQTCKLLGYVPEELKSKEATQLFAKKDRYVISWGLKGFVEESSLKDKRVYLATKAGTEIEVYLGMRFLRDAANNITGIICLAKDMTEVNRLLDEVIRSNAEISRHKQELERSIRELTDYKNVILSILEDTNESKETLEVTLAKLKETQGELLQAEKMASLGQIAAGVAHEINNPLFVISGETEMLGMDEAISQSVKDSIRVIREQVNRVVEIIRRLLEYSRKREIKFASVDINALVEKSVVLLKYQAKAVGRLEVEVKLSADPIVIQGDQNQLQEVFLNIMLNAVQAMEEKGGVLTIRVFSEIISPQRSKGRDRFQTGDSLGGVEFSDTGCGMDEETQKRIFDPFFTTKKSGTGLGLSVCAGIIENHGGSTSVESTVGKGTTFTVLFPLLKA